MKSLRMMLALVVVSLATVAMAQSDTQPSDAAKSFDKMKTLAGTWEGNVTVEPPMKDMAGNPLMRITLRETSRGNALVHEMKGAGDPDDPKRFDHPVTMVYLDGDKLTLTHYCDAGNRPHMVAKSSPDAKAVEFGLVDVSGSTARGHMDHAVFTVVDPNHHIEDWTYMMPGDKPIHAHMDLQRVK
jgi:hypothetical protein